jgi:hypothetical protein
MMGYNPRSLPHTLASLSVPAAEECVRLLQKAREEAVACHNIAMQQMAERSHGVKYTPWKVGDKVWLSAKNLKTHTSPVDILVMVHNLLHLLKPACHLHKFILVICRMISVLHIINVKSFSVLSIIIICCSWTPSCGTGITISHDPISSAFDMIVELLNIVIQR